MKNLNTRTLLKLAPIISCVAGIISIATAVINFVNGKIIFGCVETIVGIVFCVMAIIWARGLKPIRQWIKDYEEQKEKYAKMSLEELMELNDHQLVDGLYLRMLKENEKNDKEYEKFNEVKKVVYIIQTIHEEMCNGGIVEFFANSSDYSAPYVEDYLKLIGAEEYIELYSEFIKENNIDIVNLSEFKEDFKEDNDKYKKYNFKKFDDKYNELNENKPLETYLAKYARTHIELFEIRLDG